MTAALINAAAFAGLTLTIGAVATRFLVLGRSGLTISERAPAARHAAQGAMWAAALLLVSTIARAIQQVADFAEPGEAWLPVLRLVLGTTALGKALVLQAIWAAVVLLAFASARRERERGWRLAALGIVVLALTPGLLGHPVAAPQATIALTAATFHVLASGTWIGGLFHLWRATAVSSEATLLRMLDAFHGLAMGAVALLLVSGGYQTLTALHGVSNLTGTTWGRILVVKLLLVTAVLVLGHRHWRSAATQIRSGERLAVRASLGVELALATLVIALTGLLTVTAPPD